MKSLLSTREIRDFMGANRQDIDFSVIDCSVFEKYRIVYNFINKMLFVPLNKGIIFSYITKDFLTLQIERKMEFFKKRKRKNNSLGDRKVKENIT